ncbi:MAG: hypothetical protein A2474_01805 [Elusimicrobia bacterium RIFOXYC2_FULL_34_12]|nr:MAG: hypothetical protein A2474_01805 [Elusimicrobia bacterium RIFOXYC2_FULL_34_12]OGS38657.1 MAG: hypothetical protein A2551_06455 [Elusimicrobia bacterium RIFOXYD2_FULL_34_30]
MMFYESFLLGLIQGITEFLPISSSGHLVIFQKILNVGNQIEFDVFLHFATVFAIIIFFRKDVIELIKGLFGKSTIGKKMVLGIIIGSIPTAVIGFIFKDFFEAKFGQPGIVSVMLICTGLILWFSEKFSKSDIFNKNYTSTKMLDYLLIGLAQGIAIMPGISRSGATISMALLLGLKKEWAFKYSMLLSIPAVLGAGILEMEKVKITSQYFLGGIIAFFSGILALYVLSKIVVSKKLHNFSYYLWLVGILGLIFI